MIPLVAALAGVGIDFVKDLVTDHGEDLVKEGIKKVTGIDLSNKKPQELTLQEIQAIKDAEFRLKNLDFEKIKEANRHEEKTNELIVSDKQDARHSTHLSAMQTNIAEKIYNQTKVIIPLLLVTDVLLSYAAELYGINPAIIVSVSNLIGIALNNAYRERQSILEFLFGSSVGSKEKSDMLKR